MYYIASDGADTHEVRFLKSPPIFKRRRAISICSLFVSDKD